MGSSAMTVVPFDWDDAAGPGKLEQALSAQGIARIRMPGGAAATRRGRALFARLFPRRGLVRTERLLVQPRPGARSIVGSQVEAAPHIDDDELLPAHVQLLFCVKPAPIGGVNVYVDSWALLDTIRTADPALYQELFATPRTFRYRAVTAVRPTFSLRYGNLVCSQAPVPAHDEVGKRFQRWVDAAPRYELLAEPGEVCAINHQRLMHGRTRFEGERTFVRMLYWFAEPFAAPAHFRAEAERYTSAVAARNRRGPSWVREWLSPSDSAVAGLPRLAAVMAYVSGEDCEQVARRHGIAPLELVQWTARALSVAAQSLGEEDASLKRAREVIDEHTREVLGRRDETAPSR